MLLNLNIIDDAKTRLMHLRHNRWAKYGDICHAHAVAEQRWHRACQRIYSCRYSFHREQTNKVTLDPLRRDRMGILGAIVQCDIL